MRILTNETRNPTYIAVRNCTTSPGNLAGGPEEAKLKFKKLGDALATSGEKQILNIEPYQFHQVKVHDMVLRRCFSLVGWLLGLIKMPHNSSLSQS